MRKYTDEFISNEINRCKEITGIPTTLRQIVNVSKIDKGVFDRYLAINPDSDLLSGEEEKQFNKQMFIKHKQETFISKYGDPNYNNREKFKATVYDEDIKNIIQAKIEEIGHPVTVRYLSEVLPYKIFQIKNYVSYFNIPNILQGDEAKKSNLIGRRNKLREFIRNNPEKRKERLQRISNTKQLKYGDAKYNNKEKIIQSRISKMDPKFAEIMMNREKSIEFLAISPCTSREQLCEYFNTTLPSIENWIYRNNLEDYTPRMGAKSQKEIELKEILEPLGFTLYNSRSILAPYELDIYNSETNLGIEFNGNYWHSDLYKDKNYHYNKSKLAEDKNIRLIHIYEWEWDSKKLKPIILSLLKTASNNVDTKIYARNCTIKEITNKEAKLFNEANHLQNHKTAKITYGLFYKNELVQIMSFSHHKKYEWEMIRECTKLNTQVVGGCSKLFKHFLREYNPNHVFSYCDFNKFSGKSYELMGFKFIGYTGPKFKYVLKGCKQVVPKDKLVDENIIEAKLWDSGYKKYLYSK